MRVHRCRNNVATSKLGIKGGFLHTRKKKGNNMVIKPESTVTIINIVSPRK